MIDFIFFVNNSRERRVCLLCFFNYLYIILIILAFYIYLLSIFFAGEVLLHLFTVWYHACDVIYFWQSYTWYQVIAVMARLALGIAVQPLYTTYISYYYCTIHYDTILGSLSSQLLLCNFQYNLFMCVFWYYTYIIL